MPRRRAALRKNRAAMASRPVLRAPDARPRSSEGPKRHVNLARGRSATALDLPLRRFWNTLSPMKRILTMGLVCIVPLAGCRAGSPRGVHYVTTINPLRAIIAEVVGDRGDVTALLPPGASPHTYEPRPSDIEKTQTALALFSAAADIDAWAARLPARSRHTLFLLVPNEDRLVYAGTEHTADGGDGAHQHESGYNGHFWSNPRIVNSMLPRIVDMLIQADPGGLEIYRHNASRFSSELNALDAEMKSMFENLGNRPVFMFHPSWTYFMHRYGLSVAGMIEPIPGKEPTPKELKALIDFSRETRVRAVFTEPQLPRRPAQVVADACGLPLFVIDPNGGVEGRRTYRELIEYNAAVLKQALQ